MESWPAAVASRTGVAETEDVGRSSCGGSAADTCSVSWLGSTTTVGVSGFLGGSVPTCAASPTAAEPALEGGLASRCVSRDSAITTVTTTAATATTATAAATIAPRRRRRGRSSSAAVSVVGARIRIGTVVVAGGRAPRPSPWSERASASGPACGSTAAHRRSGIGGACTHAASTAPLRPCRRESTSSRRRTGSR